MKRTLLIPLILISIFLTSFVAHIETVINMSIERSKGMLDIEITMEDRYASYLLMYKGDCESEAGKGLQVHKVIRDNSFILINNKKYPIELQSSSRSGKLMKLEYTVSELPEIIKEIEVGSDLIVGYDDHARIAVRMDLNGIQRSFTIKQKRKKIIVKY